MRVAAATALLLLAGACSEGGSREAKVPVFLTECPAGSAGKLVLDLETTTPPRTQGDVTWQLIVTNADADEATLVFSSAKLGDVALERDGDEVYRWSRERSFTQAVQCFKLDPGERARLDLEHDQLEIDPGEYRLTATLNTGDDAPSMRRTITVAAR